MPIALLSIANNNSIRENLQQKTDAILIIFIAHFACSEIMIFANILSEMKRILILLVFFALGVNADGAVLRGNSGSVRQGISGQRVSTSGASVRSGATRLTSARSATTSSGRSAVQSRGAVNQKTRTVRSAKNTPVVSRAVTTMSQVSETLSGTNVGAAYDKCKAAYFACMDQFCELKNDDYRRCSCSARVSNLTDLRNSLQEAGDQLNVFTENLEIVGMTAEQVTAMRTPSEGENALTSDKSASATILQAIMNSIRGEKADVSGKYSSLNSLDLSFDTVNAFGTSDAGQVIAQYNGQELYNAVYPQCRQAVRADCTDAALQRAVTAYLMGIEQDCNTVQTAIEKKQSELKGALREGSAMLDLARIENRQKHNSDDFTTCLNNVESAILSEEVCGADYHRCLDNGEYIDISTGAPIKGVVDFYKLQEMLTFASDVALTDQKLSKVYSNQLFVKNFENRVKKFALPALDKCTENADDVWADYLDKALLDIFYAQQSKVSEIKQGCFDFVAQCYMGADASITNAMKDLIGDSRTNMQPYVIALNAEICKDYVAACDNMFGGAKKSIISQYVDELQETDTLAACRAVVKQCFDSYGGVNYENFYSPYSGLSSLDWFTLYNSEGKIVSECAKQLINIPACANQDVVEQAFGGFDYLTVHKFGNGYRYDAVSNWQQIIKDRYNIIEQTFGDILNLQETGQAYNVFNSDDSISGGSGLIIGKAPQNPGTGVETTAELYGYCPDPTNATFVHRGLRPTGVATEVYNNILDVLITDCNNKNGSFTRVETLLHDLSQEYDTNNSCILTGYGKYFGYAGFSGINMCPKGYSDSVDTQKWGACLCWENEEGDYRLTSINGTHTKCIKACVKLTLDGNGSSFTNADKSVTATSVYYVKTGVWEHPVGESPIPYVYQDISSCLQGTDSTNIADVVSSNLARTGGYTFDGFYDSKSSGHKIIQNSMSYNLVNSNYMIDSDLTLYAQWKPNCNKITLDANGRTFGGASGAKQKDVYIKSGVYGGQQIRYYTDPNCSAVSNNLLPIPYNTDRRFDGYWTSSNGGEQVTESSAPYLMSTTINSDITFYAHWKK